MQRNLASIVASSLLGVIAVAALVTGVFFYFGAWVAQQTPGTASIVDVGTTAALISGTLTIGYAAFAAFAARDEWLARPRAFVYGLIVALVAVLAAVVALVAGRANESEALLYIAAGLGSATAMALLVSAWTESRHPRPV
ncbi:MAG TPA: hypothetical protein VFN76_00980 [Candidatus Limnocylindria bacterium]|nr:hypothetical protein [Candidatus Limnocylindria bacterium]